MIDRRTFIKISGITTAVSLVPWLSGCNPNSEWTETLAKPQALGRFCSREELISIGNTYRKKFEDIRQSALEDAILGNHQPSSKEKLEAHILEKIKAEFAANDLAIVNGWVISKTEARQIALYSLLNA